MTNNTEIKETGADKPVSFEDVDDGHLKEILKLTPALRFEVEEKLLEFAVSAGAV